jgi:hypothetical protein
MSRLNYAFEPIVPKYYYHTNNAYMVIDEEYQIKDLCDNVSCEPPCPYKAQSFPLLDSALGYNDPSVNHAHGRPRYQNSPSVSTRGTFNQLPRVKLPFHPPQNIKHPYIPAFEPMYCDDKSSNRYCSHMDKC